MKKTGILFLLLFCFCAFSGNYAYSEVLSFSDDPKAIQTASASMVMINCYDRDGSLYTTGSAFAAFEENVFVTNYHVLEGETFSATIQNEFGETFDISTIVAYDIAKDIAIIRAETGTGTAPLQLGSSASLEKGEKVIAIGSPLGLINTISTGIYSGTVLESNQTFLQFSAAISQGSSGGALFNNRGEVVGITSASYTNGQNINLAIPVEVIIEMWENHFESASISIKKFYSLQEHIISINELYEDIEYYLSDDAPKKVILEGYVAEINTENKEVILVDSMDSTARYGNAVVISNLGRLQIEQFTYGGHFRVSGKIITPLMGDYIYLDGKLSKPSLLE